MTNKKNGFTLAELLASIVILGIIILIAVPAYTAVSNNVKRKQNENKISYIETQAAKYVTESGLYSDVDETSITVQTLLQNGYIDGDNKVGDMVEDIYGKDITCYQIKISFEKGKPVPEFVDKNVLNQDGICMLNDLQSRKVLALDAYSINNLNENNRITIKNNRTQWVNSDVVLKLKINDAELNAKRDQAIINIDWNAVNNNKSYSQTDNNWYTTGWLDNIANYNSATDYKNIYTVSTNKIMADTKFKITVVVNYIDNQGKRINETLTTYLIVRIDKELPTVKATVDSNWTKGNKKIYITGNDKQGSGINHFCIFNSNVTNHTCSEGDAAYVPVISEGSNKGEVTKSNGTYYVWAVDNVGNYSQNYSQVTVSNIDTTKPTCVYKNQNSTWKKSNVTITVECKDEGGSGCVTKPYNAPTYSSGTHKRENLPTSYIITDYAGNKTTCKGPVNIYVDKQAPTINTFSYSKGVITIKVSDTGEGELDKYELINKSSNEVIKTGTSLTNPYEETYSYKIAGTYILKVYDKAGNTSTKEVTIPSYTVSFTIDHGSVTNASKTVNYNENASTTFSVGTGYQNATVSGTGCTISGTTVKASNVTGDVTCAITTSAIKYTISYQTNNSNCPNGSDGNKSEYYVSTATFTLTNPTCTGYTFNGWTGSNGDTAQTSVSVAKGSTGNKTYKATWTINKYYLDLNGLLDGTNSGNITGYGTADIYINGSVVKNDITDYYTEWDYGTSYEIKDIKANTGYKYDGLASGSKPIKGTITDHVNVRLQFSTHTNYTISYNLNGGSVSPDNPSSYNVSTATFTLNNPTRSNYKFMGWSNDNSTVYSKDGNITCNSNLYYGPYFKTGAGLYRVDIYGTNLNSATFDAYEYNTSNVLLRGVTVESATHAILIVEVIGNANSSGIEITVTRAGGVTVTKEEIRSLSSSVSIAKGSTGNRAFTANWIPNSLKVVSGGKICYTDTQNNNTVVCNDTAYGALNSGCFAGSANSSFVTGDTMVKAQGWYVYSNQAHEVSSNVTVKYGGYKTITYTFDGTFNIGSCDTLGIVRFTRGDEIHTKQKECIWEGWRYYKHDDSPPQHVVRTDTSSNGLGSATIQLYAKADKSDASSWSVACIQVSDITLSNPR